MAVIATIDKLVQRIEETKIYQEHLKLIVTRLARLQHLLNGTDDTLTKDIEQTLEVLDDIVTHCSDSETNLNGITYKDLESRLFRLQCYLTQREVHRTDSQAMKIEILSNSYQEQQLLTKTDFEETVKQRLETIDQSTKENTIEQFRLLQDKYAETVNSCLRRCNEVHSNVPLPGLTIDTVVKVAQTFYQISSQDQIQLRNNWQVGGLPLTCTFIQFKSDKLTVFERNEARRRRLQPTLESITNSTQRQPGESIWYKSTPDPYRTSTVQQNQQDSDDNLSEEEAIIRTQRWLVILGEPGSGKTSFARRLVRRLAERLLVNEHYSTEYGPLRIPILIRIGGFSNMLSDQPSLTLFDYVGKHQWMGKPIVDDTSISVRTLLYALQEYIKQGQALIILDGLDEIPVSEQRSRVLQAIENFVDTYVQVPRNSPVVDNLNLNKLFDDPSRLGGNQLIVTSCIVGYDAAPLAGYFAHYTIQPMDLDHMKNYVDYWFFQVHQRILNALRFPLINQGENHSEVLKKELEKTENVGLLHLASNSFLLSYICATSVRESENSSLPIQRIRLYEPVINSMLRLWNNSASGLDTTRIGRILGDIASHIYENSTSGCIDQKTVEQICQKSYKTFASDGHLSEGGIEGETSQLVRIIVEDIGILTIRDKSLYGFRHLPFQQYFVALKLLNEEQVKQQKITTDGADRENEIQLVAQALRRHIDDPRFQTPIALALGKVSASWSQNDFDRLCNGLIHEENELNSLLPLGAYTLVIFLKELVNYPSDDVLFKALDILLVAAGQHNWSVVCPFLIDPITNALRQLRNDIVPLWINSFLTRSPPHDIQTLSALCHLLQERPHCFDNIRWLDQSSCSILQSLSVLDNANNHFSIDHLLVKVAFSNHQLLPTNSATLKGFLIGEEIELNSISMVLLPLITTLYGGLKREDQNIIFDPSHIHRESSVMTPILTRFLAVKDRAKQIQALKKLKQECIRSFLSQMHNHDESCEAVDLCIAIICLYGIEYVQDNLTIISASVLRLTMDRLKYVSMILRQFYFVTDNNDRSIENETTRMISAVIEKFQYGDSGRVQFLDLLDALRSGLARLRSSKRSSLLDGESIPDQRVTLYLPNTLRKEGNLLNGLLSTDIWLPSDRSSCSLLPNFTGLFYILENDEELSTQYRMAVALDTIPNYVAFRNDEDISSSLTFVPRHLRNLYLRLLMQKLIIFDSKDTQRKDQHHLYFSHILVECLMTLSNSSCKRLSMLPVLITLLPWLRINQLENFGSSLLWSLATKYSDYFGAFETKRQRPINHETGQYMDRDNDLFNGCNVSDEQRSALIKSYIDQEHERLRNALSESNERNMNLFSASVSLAHVGRWAEDERRLFLLNESMQGAMSITNKLVRLDALCIISFYAPSSFTKMKVNTGRSIREEIEYQFNDIYPTLPLLLHATILIRCLPLLQHQELRDKYLQNLFDKFGNNDPRDQQGVIEALTPYLQAESAFYSLTKETPSDSLNIQPVLQNTSSVLMKYSTTAADQTPSFSLHMSNLYLMELARDFHRCIRTDRRHFNIDDILLATLFPSDSSILKEAQVLALTNILSSAASSNQSERLQKLCPVLDKALHRMSWVEFKSRHLLQSWMQWKDSNELSSFANHAALLLINSDLWSTEAATIVCDLLRSETDRFRQRAETIFREKSDDNARTSSILGIDVLLTLVEKKNFYQVNSASTKLTLGRLLGNTTLDVQSHLETFLWLERYRIHALANKDFSLNTSRVWGKVHVAAFISNDVIINGSSYVALLKISGDLIIYMCDMISSDLFSFLEIDGDTTSDAVLESHIQFVVCVVVNTYNLLNNNDDTRQIAVEALSNLFEMSYDDRIRQAVVYALGYVSNEKTYKTIFEKIQIATQNDAVMALNYSTDVLIALISSYCYCVSINNIQFDADDIELFCNLLKHSSDDVIKAVCTGYARVLPDTSFLLDLLGFDQIRCYQGLLGSTASLFLYEVNQNKENAVADLVEQNPALLSIFVTQLYHSIQHYTSEVITMTGIEYDLAYGHPQYVRVAGIIAVRISATFCAYVNNWSDEERLKRALFYTSKQHNFPQRAACLTILSVFGELTVELCEMFVAATHDDPHIQSISDTCLARIRCVKDEKVVFNVLFFYLKSRSITVRHMATKLLHHLSKWSLIPFEKVRVVLKELISDPSSEEDLWLIEKQDATWAECVYYNAGPLKNVLYSLLIQYLTEGSNENVRTDQINRITLDFIESARATHFASCLYEANTVETAEKEEDEEKSSLNNNSVSSSERPVSPDFDSSVSDDSD